MKTTVSLTYTTTCDGW